MSFQSRKGSFSGSLASVPLFLHPVSPISLPLISVGLQGPYLGAQPEVPMASVVLGDRVLLSQSPTHGSRCGNPAARRSGSRPSEAVDMDQWVSGSAGSVSQWSRGQGDQQGHQGHGHLC